MAADEIRQEIGYQRENQTNIGWAGNRLTDSGNTKITWTFIAISNEMDDYAERKANQKGRPRGLVYEASDLNMTVWAKTWSEVLNDAKSRLQFINKQLSYEADRDSSSGYLKRAHAKFIPDMTAIDGTTES